MKCLPALAAFALSAAATPSAERRAQLDSKLTDAITTTSGTHLPRSNTALPQKRAASKNDCPGKEKYINQAMTDCASKARDAQQAARNGSSEIMGYFFKSDDQETREKVASLYGKIIEECDAKGAGSTTISCVDQRNTCQGEVIASVVRSPDDSSSRVVLCDQFFQLNGDGDGPGTVQKRAGKFKPSCGRQDSASALLHEMTHALGKTKDFEEGRAGAYGLKAVQGLDAQENILHADTYSLFAHAISRNCSVEELQREESQEIPPGGPPRSFNGASNEVSGPQPRPDPNQASPFNGRPQAPGQGNVPQTRPPVPGQESPVGQPAVPGDAAGKRPVPGQENTVAPPLDPFQCQNTVEGLPLPLTGQTAGQPPASIQQNTIDGLPFPVQDNTAGQPSVSNGPLLVQGNTVNQPPASIQENPVNGPPFVQGNTIGEPPASIQGNTVNGPPFVQGNTVGGPSASIQENTGAGQILSNSLRS